MKRYFQSFTRIFPLVLVVVLLLTMTASAFAEGGAESNNYQDPIVRRFGVNFTYLPPNTEIVRDQYLSSAYGFTVVDAEGRLLVRVEWLQDTSPAEIDLVVQKFMKSFAGIQVHRVRSSIGGHDAEILSPIPGQVETAAAFVSTNNRLYRIFYNSESDAGLKIMRSITLFSPEGDISTIGLRRAEDALYDSPPWAWRIDPQKPSDESLVEDPSLWTLLPQPQAYTPPGCVNFPTWKFLQTQKDAHLVSSSGGIYGGHSAQPIKVHYFRNGGGDYWYISQYQWMGW